MPKVIAMAGKEGTEKTTITTLFTKYLLAKKETNYDLLVSSDSSTQGILAAKPMATTTDPLRLQVQQQYHFRSRVPQGAHPILQRKINENISSSNTLINQELSKALKTSVNDSADVIQTINAIFDKSFV